MNDRAINDHDEQPAPETTPADRVAALRWCTDTEQALASLASFRPLANTGLVGLNNLLGGGFVPGLHIIGGVPGGGKTTFAAQLANYAARFSAKDVRVIFFSLEEPRARFIQRSIANLMHEQARGGTCSTMADLVDQRTIEDATSAMNAITAFSQYGERIAVQDGIHTAEQIADVVSDCAQAGYRPLVFVDHHLCLSSSSSDERLAIKADIAALTEAANSAKCPVILLAQLARASVKNAVKSMSDFSGSGAIEQAATTCSIIDMEGANQEAKGEEAQKPVRSMVLDVVKNRWGLRGRVNLVFYARHARFQELAEGY